MSFDLEWEKFISSVKKEHTVLDKTLANTFFNIGKAEGMGEVTKDLRKALDDASRLRYPDTTGS